MLLKKTILTTALAWVYTTSSAGELSFPVEPPTAQQLQKPANNDKVTGATLPISLKQTIANQEPDNEHIIKLIEQLLANKPRVNLISNTTKSVTTQEGQARNIAITPVQAQLNIQVNISKTESPLIGADYLPVKLELRDTQGKIVSQKNFDYRPTEEKQFIQAIEQMLSPYLGQTRSGKITEPQLKTWLETEDGKPIKVGSSLAIYFQTDSKGYVSLYHFSHDKTVQRLYPSIHEPVNFVQPGVIYRYPAKNYLKVTGKPGEDLIKAIFTRWSSNMPRVVDGLSSKTAPLNVIPTHYPVLFANGEMSRFFALPKTHYTESHLHYKITQ